MTRHSPARHTNLAPTRQRALLYLYEHAGRDGASCYDVGGALWPDRAGRVASAGGGGDYAAQMLLGRMRKAGLVEYAPSEGVKEATRWRLSPEGLREVQHLARRAVPRVPASDTDRCTCGHAPEEHDDDPRYPGSTSCTACDCIAYEASSRCPSCAAPLVDKSGLRCVRCGWQLITRKEWEHLPSFRQGYLLYMQGAWPGSELAGLRNPYPEGSSAWRLFRDGETRAVLDAQDGEE